MRCVYNAADREDDYAHNAPAVGNFVEFYQWIMGDAIGMNRQDFYSNVVGYQFYSQLNFWQNLFYPSTFADQIYRFFFGPCF